VIQKYKTILRAVEDRQEKATYFFIQAWVVQIDGRRERIKKVSALLAGEEPPREILTLEDPRIVRRIKKVGTVLEGIYWREGEEPRRIQRDPMFKQAVTHLVDKADNYVKKLQKKRHGK
jgi:hypothetical protein